MFTLPSCKIFPLGDSALTIDFGNVIDPLLNEYVIALFHFFKDHPLPCMIETVPAYSSITIYYDLIEMRKKIKGHSTAFASLKREIDDLLKTELKKAEINERVVRIPVCYDREFAIDIEKIAASGNISVDDVISIHSGENYKVYMLGFLPGFAYMGQVNEKISFERKAQPESIKAGSVGIAGRQTGIYPFDSPGGWQIIGRTPLKIFNSQATDPALLQAGDIVQFYSITKNEFEDIKGRIA
jgi:inhibitor of KinA